MIKSCGGCKFWAKMSGIGGLCEKYDAKANSDSVCDGWKGIKFTRKSKCAST